VWAEKPALALVLQGFWQAYKDILHALDDKSPRMGLSVVQNHENKKMEDN